MLDYVNDINLPYKTHIMCQKPFYKSINLAYLHNLGKKLQITLCEQNYRDLNFFYHKNGFGVMIQNYNYKMCSHLKPIMKNLFHRLGSFRFLVFSASPSGNSRNCELSQLKTDVAR